MFKIESDTIRHGHRTSPDRERIVREGGTSVCRLARIDLSENSCNNLLRDHF